MGSKTRDQGRKRFGPLVWEDVNLAHYSCHEHSATLVGNGLYIFGGSARGRGLNGDLKVVKQTGIRYEETEVALEGEQELPKERRDHTCNLVDDRLYIFGGVFTNQRLTNELCAFDLVLSRWCFVETFGARRPVLHNHISEYSPALHGVVCFGGRLNESASYGVEVLDMHTFTWNTLKPKGQEPPPRLDAASCMLNNTVFIFGGWNESGMLQDTHLLNLSITPTLSCWSSPKVKGLPTGRINAALAYYHGKVILFGGLNTEYLASVYAYDPCQETWTKGLHKEDAEYKEGECVEVQGPEPHAREGHTMSWMWDDSLVVYGGTSPEHPTIRGLSKLKLVQ